MGLSLAEAQQALHASPAWFAEARAAEALHEELLEALDEEELEDDTDPPRDSR